MSGPALDAWCSVLSRRAAALDMSADMPSAPSPAQLWAAGVVEWARAREQYGEFMETQSTQLQELDR